MQVQFQNLCKFFKKNLKKNTINLTVDITMNVWLEAASDTEFDLDYLDTIG